MAGMTPRKSVIHSYAPNDIIVVRILLTWIDRYPMLRLRVDAYENQWTDLRVSSIFERGYSLHMRFALSMQKSINRQMLPFFFRTQKAGNAHSLA